MRTTKALLLTAAASAAGILAAQAQVYSVNVVGFVNLDLKAGYNMIANSLNGTNNLLSTIIPNPPDATVVTMWNGVDQSLGTGYTYLGGGVWDPDGNLEVAPGEGLLVFLGADARLTFVGEVPQGSLTNQVGGNVQFKASQVPQAGLLVTDLGFVPKPADVVSQWDASIQDYSGNFTYLGGGAWDPAEPSMKVGEAFFLLRDPAEGGPDGWWVRNFTVQ
jgi:hypothetical protein